MIANFHTHSVFCDGKNTPEEIVLAAMARGFSAIGFSGHGYTDYDVRYCMTDTDGYVVEINRLKEAYGQQIQIYLGAEEDAFCPVDRAKFDYLIGSCHYLHKDGRYYPIDSGSDYLKRCIEAFDGDSLAFAEGYYQAFCDYIKRRKPDIIGHFDLITKFDQREQPVFLQDPGYHRLAERYIREAAQSGCIFEVNTGAMAKGWRTTPYPSENLLHVLKKLDAPLILSSDSHSADTLDHAFTETRQFLKDMGFTHLHTLQNGTFQKYAIE